MSQLENRELPLVGMVFWLFKVFFEGFHLQCFFQLETTKSALGKPAHTHVSNGLTKKLSTTNQITEVISTAEHPPITASTVEKIRKQICKTQIKNQVTFLYVNRCTKKSWDKKGAQVKLQPNTYVRQLLLFWLLCDMERFHYHWNQRN